MREGRCLSCSSVSVTPVLEHEIERTMSLAICRSLGFARSGCFCVGEDSPYFPVADSNSWPSSTVDNAACCTRRPNQIRAVFGPAVVDFVRLVTLAGSIDVLGLPSGLRTAACFTAIVRLRVRRNLRDLPSDKVKTVLVE